MLGIGACSTALKRIGIDVEIVDAVEIDKYAIASFNAIHGTNFEVQDICEWDKDIKDIDLITHGSPCFLKGEKVNTKDGFKNIENIKIGDYVKSHNGSYNKVIKTFRSRNNKIVDIQASAIHNINTTDNHPFLVKRNDKIGWLQVKELTTKDFFCIPINKKNEDIDCTSNLPIKSIRFWYLIGRFIGDGWITRRKERNNNISGIKICCAKNELKDLECKLCNILHYCVVEDKSTYKIQFSNKELGEFCSQFGIGAKNKHIPQWVLDLKKEYLEYLLMGIIDSDGCFSQNKYKVTTISRDLAYNIGELVLKVKNVPYHLYKTIRPKKYKIENREVNQNNTYQITWSDSYNKNINFLDDNFLYSRVRKIKKRTEVNTVYNIEVENTHSYCVNNVATHNCQDFSVAGKQAGGDIGSGTRSSLMYETIRIVGKIRPKYVLWENVKNLLSKKHKHNFDAYIETMNILGYNSYYQVLNAKDYGIPQNRERVYTISIRKDIDKGFKFPEKEELKLRLKDMLEDKVDEKYYLSDEQINNFIKNNNGNCNPSGKGMNGKVHSGDIVPTITTNKGEGLKIKVVDWKDPKCVRIGGIFDTEKSKHQAGSVYDKEGLSPTLDAMQGGWRQPCIEEHKIITHSSYVSKKYEEFIEDKGYIPEMFNPYHKTEIKDIAPTQSTYCGSTTSSATVLIKENNKANKYDVNELAPTLTQQEEKIITIGNYMPSGHNASRIVDSEGLAPTVKENHGTVTATNQNLRIRKLTPKECWRLMGFSDEDFEKAVNIPTSNTQLYKQARK